MDIRVLGAGDAPALERFLVEHRDTSMFLRSNARRAGLVYEGAAYQATYVAAFDEGEILGVVGHAWNGMVMVQAPDHLDELARAAVALSGRRVTSFSGPADQVDQAARTLGLADAPAKMRDREGFFVLPISELVIPPALATGVVECRPPRPTERNELLAWRVAYDIEALGATDSVETRARSARFLDAQIADGNAWVAVKHGRLVSLSAFNAALPDIVQLGGIYTPPEHRSRGYARAAVAAALLVARERGVERAVLFAKNPSAIRCYDAVGFRRVGEFGLVLLE